MRCMILSTRTAVFPDPAAAETRRFVFLVSMALSCSLVHWLLKGILSFLHFFPKLLNGHSFQGSVLVCFYLSVKLANALIGTIGTWNFIFVLVGFDGDISIKKFFQNSSNGIQNIFSKHIKFLLRQNNFLILLFSVGRRNHFPIFTDFRRYNQ